MNRPPCEQAIILPAPTTPTLGTRGRRLRAVLPAIALALAAFVWLSYLNQPALLSDDEVRDQLLARDCTDLGRCHVSGANASYKGLYHGANWPDVLIAVRLLGGDISSFRTVVFALLASSAATLFIVVAQWLSPPAALPAAVLFTWAVAYFQSPGWLTNPCLAAFPDLLAAAGLLCYGLSGRRRFLALSAVALGVNMHVASFAIVIPFLAIAALARPRPWFPLAASVGIALAVYSLTSSAALRANLTTLANQGLVLPAILLCAVVVFTFARLGDRFRRLSWNARAWIIGLIQVVPFAVAASWFVLRGNHFAAYHLHPILGPSAALAGGLLVVAFEAGTRRIRISRWIPTALSVGAIALATLGVVRPPDLPGKASAWSMDEAKAIADHATQLGWSYEDMVFHLQSDECTGLLRGMSVEAPAPVVPLRRGRRQLQVVKVSRELLAHSDAPADVVSLGPTTVAVLRGVESWLRPESLRACRVPLDNGGGEVCTPALPLANDAIAPDRFLFVSRSYPEIHLIDLPLPYIARYEIPLAPSAGEYRDVVLADRAAPDCGWLITRVEGLEVDGALPSEHVRLASESGAAGLLVLEKPFGVAACPSGDFDRRYPPCLLETVPDDSRR